MVLCDWTSQALSCFIISIFQVFEKWKHCRGCWYKRKHTASWMVRRQSSWSGEKRKAYHCMEKVYFQSKPHDIIILIDFKADGSS